MREIWGEDKTFPDTHPHQLTGSFVLSTDHSHQKIQISGSTIKHDNPNVIARNRGAVQSNQLHVHVHVYFK